MKKTIDDGMFLNKELCINGIGLCVEARFALLIDETVKFSLTLF